MGPHVFLDSPYETSFRKVKGALMLMEHCGVIFNTSNIELVLGDHLQ